MSKELTPLEALERIKKHLPILYPEECGFDNVNGCFGPINECQYELDIIESALKRLEVYETFDLLDEKDDVDKLTDIKGKLTYVEKVMDTQERLLASVSSDEIRILSSVLNSQTRNLKKKLKALEIIKNKPQIEITYIQWGKIKTYDEYLKEVCEWDLGYEDMILTKEEFDLVKEELL